MITEIIPEIIKIISNVPIMEWADAFCIETPLISDIKNKYE